MKEETKQILESILNEELNGYVNSCEINNTILKMDNGFDANVNIDKQKLNQAVTIAINYLKSICLPTHVLATQAIYYNKILIAMGKIELEFN